MCFSTILASMRQDIGKTAKHIKYCVSNNTVVLQFHLQKTSNKNDKRQIEECIETILASLICAQ